jgi:hypothetical protein
MRKDCNRELRLRITVITVRATSVDKIRLECIERLRFLLPKIPYHIHADSSRCSSLDSVTEHERRVKFESVNNSNLRSLRKVS